MFTIILAAIDGFCPYDVKFEAVYFGTVCVDLAWAIGFSIWLCS